jgi:hypothetical protein
MVRVDVLPFGGIEEFPNVGKVMAVVYSNEAHDGSDVILGLPFAGLHFISPS